MRPWAPHHQNRHPKARLKWGLLWQNSGASLHLVDWEVYQESATKEGRNSPLAPTAMSPAGVEGVRGVGVMSTLRQQKFRGAPAAVEGARVWAQCVLGEVMAPFGAQISPSSGG